MIRGTNPEVPTHWPKANILLQYLPMGNADTNHCPTCASRVMNIFCSLPVSLAKELDHAKTSNIYKRGQSIFYEGNSPFGIYCIFSGKIKLFKTSPNGKQIILKVLKQGDVLGYRSLFSEEPYAASAEVIEDAQVCFISKDLFFKIVSQSPATGWNTIKLLSKELGLAETKVTDVATKSARVRMSELLLMLKGTYGKKSKRGILLDIRLKREEIAEMIGTTQETAIRLVNELKEDGILRLEDHQIWIVDEAKLQELTELPY
jgi:CRP-like cAMP-binding protein